MILVIGALASGKRTYARSLGFDEADMAFDVHERLRAGEDPAAVERSVRGKRIVTFAEVGSGVVPLDAGERAWREKAGRLMARLAADADRVVRMVCGIPTVLQDVVRLELIRHGQTPGNDLRQYVGVVDQPLSERGREQARAAGVRPEVARVYVSRLRRTHETASIMFPNAEQVVVDGVHEMDFGTFAGRSADDMADDPEYQAWVDGWCMGRCPGGETRDEFTDRVCSGMERFLRDAASHGEHDVILVAHGGTMMASLSSFTDDPRSYYDWHVGNCESYHIRAILRPQGMSFEICQESDS